MTKTIFLPKTTRVEKLSQIYLAQIEELKKIFDKKTSVYIDFANIFHWFERLGWHIDVKRLKQLLDSFSNIDSVKFYNGSLKSDPKSEEINNAASRHKYDLRTKPVKIMYLPIDVSGIPLNSPDVLKKFIEKSLLKHFDLGTIEFLNKKLAELNQKGINHIKKHKCNFDVEIGRDMMRDYDKNQVENFILWSGDSDFADPVEQLLNDGKKVIIFATARRVAPELSDTKAQIFEINKIRDFICWPKEISKQIKSKI